VSPRHHLRRRRFRPRRFGPRRCRRRNPLRRSHHPSRPWRWPQPNPRSPPPFRMRHSVPLLPRRNPLRRSHHPSRPWRRPQPNPQSPPPFQMSHSVPLLPRRHPLATGRNALKRARMRREPRRERSVSTSTVSSLRMSARRIPGRPVLPAYSRSHYTQARLGLRCSSAIATTRWSYRPPVSRGRAPSRGAV
jgi:hypothetical protein